MAKPTKKIYRKRHLFLLLSVILFVMLSIWMISLDRQIRDTFDGNKWSVPATVYARPLELYVGAPLSINDLQTELTQLGFQFVRALSGPGQAIVNGQHADIYTRGFRFADGQSAPRKVSLSIKDGQISELHSDDGVSLLRLSPVVIGGIYPAHHEDRLLVQLHEVPDTLLDMLVAVEDNQFYEHAGISLRGIARAALANIKGGGFSQGASTLTQQLVKNYYLNADKTLSRKVKEAFMSILLELRFSKQAILEGYINEIYLGQDGPRAIHGFGLASQYYFKKPLQQLTLAEQAMLVTLVRGASYYNPWRHPERVQARRNMILDIAVREGRLEQQQAETAKLQTLGLGDKQQVVQKRYPAYLDLVRRQLQRDYPAQDLASKGLSIFTHFDPLVQQSAEQSVARMVKKQNNRRLQAAVVVSRPNTGEVIAIVGGNDARYAGFNRALDAQRQIGSLIKPALYLSALTKGDDYHLATPLSDAPFELVQDNQQVWAPQNYDKQFHGDVLLYRALAHSYNVAAARLGQEIGLDALVDTLTALGATRHIEPHPSLTLGTVSMSPFEVTQIYQTLSAEGFYTPLFSINAVLDAQGNTLSRYPLAIEQRFSPEAIYLLRYALQAVTHEGSAKSLQQLLPDLAVAGKTGTTNQLKDSWFAGFSGDMMSVVWLGHDDNSSMGLTGASGALRVWADIFRAHATLGLQNIPPEQIQIAWVDNATGQGSEESCENAIAMPFIKGSAPHIEQRCRHGVQKVFDWFRDILQ